jgi:hypothetical protein
MEVEKIDVLSFLYDQHEITDRVTRLVQNSKCETLNKLGVRGTGGHHNQDNK